MSHSKYLSFFDSFYKVLLSLYLPLGIGITILIPYESLQASAQPYVLCKNGKFVRSIRIHVDENKGCTTKYTKAGVDRIVAESESVQSCHSVLENIKSNLIESRLWSCKDVKSVGVQSTRSASR